MIRLVLLAVEVTVSRSRIEPLQQAERQKADRCCSISYNLSHDRALQFNDMLPSMTDLLKAWTTGGSLMLPEADETDGATLLG
jgi:hypothetical protein